MMELARAIDSRPIQLLFLDDSGVNNQSAPEKVITEKVIIRRRLESKRRNGLIILNFAVQDYFLLDKKLRSTLYVEFLKSAPTNLSDLNALTRIIGDDAITHLKTCQREWLIKSNYAALSSPVVRVLDQVGYYQYEYIEAADSQLRQLTTSYNQRSKERERQAKVKKYRKMLESKQFSKSRDLRKKQQIKYAVEGFRLGLSKTQIKGILGIGDEKVNLAWLQYQEESE